MDDKRIKDESILVRLGNAEDVLDLRHICLRQGLPRETASFEGDTEPTTLHAIAESSGQIIGCATLLRRPWNQEPAWQLRGMAVDSTRRRSGVGAALLRFLETQAAQQRFSPQLWCNARVPAAGFYQRAGWTIVSGVFEIPTAGPHVKMIKSLI